MRGSIIRRGNRWSVVIDRGRGPDGRRIRDWHSGFASEAEAERARTRLLSQQDQGSYVAPERLTLGAYLDRWLEHVRRDLERGTCERYESLIRCQVKPHAGGVRLQKLTPLDVQRLYDRLLVSGRVDGRGGLAPRTVGHVHRMLSKALKQAVRWQLVTRNVCVDIDPPRVRASRTLTLEREQAAKLLTAASGTPMWMVVVLGLATGARRGELLALRWADVDLDANELRYERQLRISNAGELYFKRPKSDAGIRALSLPAFAAAALRRHRATQAETRLLLGAAYDTEGDLVIAKADGSPYRPDYVSGAVSRLIRSAGLPRGAHLHSLRHTAASLLAAEGASPVEIAEVLGHADPGFTMRTYAHPLRDGRDKAAATLERILGVRDA